MLVTLLLASQLLATPAEPSAGGVAPPQPSAESAQTAPGDPPRKDGLSRAGFGAVGTAVAGVAGLGALLALASWGAVAGASLGALFALGGSGGTVGGGSRPFFNVALFAGAGAVVGLLASLPLALVARVGVDTLTWLFITAGRARPDQNARADIPILVVSSIAAVFMTLAAGVALLVRAPQGGLTRDPLGSVVWVLAAAGVAVLPSIPLLTGAIILRAVLWWWMTR